MVASRLDTKSLEMLARDVISGLANKLRNLALIRSDRHGARRNALATLHVLQ